MFPSVDRRWLMAGIILALVLGATVPACAMDKLFRFWSPDETGADIKAVRAFTNAMEIVTDQHDSWRNPWENFGDGSNVDYVLKSGVYCTRIIYNDLEEPLPSNTSSGEQWSWDKAMKIGWSTASGTCRLNDLRWAYNSGGTDSITDAEDVGSQVDGGGYVIGPDDDGVYWWYVTNESETLNLVLMNLELTWIQQPPWELDMGYLDTAMEEGGIGLLTRTLGDAVIEAGVEGDLKDPSVKSLLGKLESASEDHLAGLAAYEAGDPVEAEQDWAAAIKHMETFIKEIETSMKTGKIREDLALLWVPIAEEIIYRLDLLPEVKPPDTIPSGYDIVEPLGERVIPLIGAQPGDSVFLQGLLVNGAGEVILNWVDKADIEEDMNPPTVYLKVNGELLDPETDLPLPWYGDDVEVELTLSEAGTIRVVDYTADELVPDPDDSDVLVPPAWVEVAPPWSATYVDEGEYTITYIGVDETGNTSDVQTVIVRIDKTAPTIDVSPGNIWPPNHEYVPIEIVVNDNLPGLEWSFMPDPDTGELVLSNEPDEGTGDGDYPNDIVLDLDDVDGDGIYLWLRAERAGVLNTRVYSFAIHAEDAAGNWAELPVEIPVTHDQGT